MTHITHILITAGIVSLFASCAQKDSQDQKPVEQAVTKKAVNSATTKRNKAVSQASQGTQTMTTNGATASTRTRANTTTASISPTAFRTPADDIKLPTDAEMAEGQGSSIGGGSKPSSAPSISVTPSTTASKTGQKEDQLDP